MPYKTYDNEWLGSRSCEVRVRTSPYLSLRKMQYFTDYYQLPHVKSIVADSFQVKVVYSREINPCLSCILLGCAAMISVET